MDNKTNDKGPSSTEDRAMKVGDKVWVLCEVVSEPDGNGVHVTHRGAGWYADLSACKPVEPEAVEQPATSDPSGEWEPTKDEIEYAKDRCGVPASDPLAVGDAVRFVSPGHDRHGTEGTLKSIHHGSKYAYLFVSNCGQFHRYCTIAELERADQADPIDIKGSMQSLDGADTIQAGDLQWTDRDGKYRLCNFTIGMRVHEAIQRGKAHGEKWVFYRKFREAGE